MSSFYVSQEKRLSIKLWHTNEYRGILLSEMWKSISLNRDQWNLGSNYLWNPLREDPRLKMDSSEHTAVSLHSRWDSWLPVRRTQPSYGASLFTGALEVSCWHLEPRHSQELSLQGHARAPLRLCLPNHVHLQHYSLSLIFPTPLFEFPHKFNFVWCKYLLCAGNSIKYFAHRGTGVAWWLSICFQLGSWSWGPWMESCIMLLAGSCFSSCLCLCLSLCVSYE